MRNGRPRGAPGIVVLEKPNEQQDDDDERDETATDIHSGLLCSVVAGTTGQAEREIRPATMKVRGDVAEWLGRGLQSLVQRFESARRLFFPQESVHRWATSASPFASTPRRRSRRAVDDERPPIDIPGHWHTRSSYSGGSPISVVTVPAARTTSPSPNSRPTTASNVTPTG